MSVLSDTYDQGNTFFSHRTTCLHTCQWQETYISSCINLVSAVFSFFFFFSPSLSPTSQFQPISMEVAGFQRDGVCKDDISMVRVKAVFVFSIRLIRTVTGNTWRSRCVPACLRKTCVSAPVYMYRGAFMRVCRVHEGWNRG